MKYWIGQGLKLGGLVVGAFFLLFSPVLVGWIAKSMGSDFDTGLRAAAIIYSWPVISGVSIMVALVLFRVPLRNLIGRIQSVKGGSLELYARAEPSGGEEQRRVFLDRIDRWIADAGNRSRLNAWAHTRRRGSLTFILNSATVSEVEEIIKTFEIP